jgi:SAM-dependent methyltransferase
MKTTQPGTNLFFYGIRDENEKINQHPWILSREKCILNTLKNKNLHNVADIGVNDMYYTRKIKSFADGKVYAVDIFFPDDGEIRDGIICLNDISKLPENEFDCILMMDMLEYIKDDEDFLNKAAGKLKDGGMILITLPAWSFLFSVHDIRAQHIRRYDRKKFLELLKKGPLQIEKCHYFYTILFFGRLIGMLKKSRYNGNEIAWKYPEKHIVTVLVRLVLDIDFMINKILNKVAVLLPGLSLLIVCKKDSGKAGL